MAVESSKRSGSLGGLSMKQISLIAVRDENQTYLQQPLTQCPSLFAKIQYISSFCVTLE